MKIFHSGNSYFQDELDREKILRNRKVAREEYLEKRNNLIKPILKGQR